MATSHSDQSVEFTYMIMPSALTVPGPHFTWPGIVMIVTPTRAILAKCSLLGKSPQISGFFGGCKRLFTKEIDRRLAHD